MTEKNPEQVNEHLTIREIWWDKGGTPVLRRGNLSWEELHMTLLKEGEWERIRVFK